ncbi:hypothetical protein [Kineococcus sp. SYSU DK006]|uniref:hypothetical protein n=1 Tax=Kineococcus sp. SYSU DK006 TaxID=3383127 RepID=UPI003D7DCE7F
MLDAVDAPWLLDRLVELVAVPSLGAWATPRRGHRNEACVIPEPTASAVMTAYAGALTFHLTLTGLAATPGSAPSNCSSTSTPRCWPWSPPASPPTANSPTAPASGTTPSPTASIGRMRAGEWASTVPDRLVAEGRFGVRPNEPVEAARAAFEGCVAARVRDPPLAGRAPGTG